MSGTLQRLMAELRAGLAHLYGSRLQVVTLFGPYARGEADAESDVDVLIILDEFRRYGAEVDRTAELVADLSLKYTVSLSTVFVRRADWLNGDTPFLANVRKESIAA